MINLSLAVNAPGYAGAKSGTVALPPSGTAVEALPDNPGRIAATLDATYAPASGYDVLFNVSSTLLEGDPADATPIAPGETLITAETFSGTLYPRFYLRETATGGIAAVTFLPAITITGVSVAPVLSAASASLSGPDAVAGTVTSDTVGGTLYWVATDPSAAPAAAQVIAGQTVSGAAAPAAGSQAVLAAGVQTVSATGLALETAYVLHFVQTDGAGNVSAVVTTAGFATPAPVTAASPQSLSLAIEESGTSYDIAAFFSGGAGELSFAAVSNDRPEDLSLSGNVLTVTGEDYTAAVTIRGTDAFGQSADLTLTVTMAGPTAAPVLTSPTATVTGADTATGTVTTDTVGGGLHWVATAPGTAPLVSQIKAGQTESGAPAPASGSRGAPTSGALSVAVSGLAPGSSYALHFVHTDRDGNVSAVVTTAAFAMPAPVAADSPQSLTLTTAQSGTSYDLAPYFSGGAGTLGYTVVSNDRPEDLSLSGSLLTVAGTVTGYEAAVVIRGTDTLGQWADLTLAVTVVGTDTQEPILLAPTASLTAADTAEGSVSTDEAGGTLYWAAADAEATLAMEDVIVGQVASGVPADVAGSQEVTATGVQTVTVAGLAPETPYRVHYVHVDAAGNASAVATSTAFATPAPVAADSPQSLTLTAVQSGTSYDLAPYFSGGAGTLGYTVVSNDRPEDLSLSGSLLTVAGADYDAAATIRGTDTLGQWADLVVNVTVDAPDTVAPVLTNAAAAAAGASGATGAVSTDEAGGTLYWVVTGSATPPTETQIKAGQTASGAAAPVAGNQGVPATGEQTVNVAGLAAETTYSLHFLQTDAAGNASSVVSTAAFTTAAPGTLTLDAFSRDKTIFDSGAHLKALTKRDVMALSDPTQTGPQWSGAYKTPGNDPLPNGVSLSGTTITIGSGFSGWLEGWDFTGYGLNWTGGEVRMRHCILGERDGVPRGIFFYLLIGADARVVDISYNLFEGPNSFGGAIAAIRRALDGSGLNITSAGEGHVYRNRFINLTEDAFKISGGEVYENYIRYDRNLSAPAYAWSSNTTYNTGDLVRSPSNENHIWRSKTDGNQGNTPPSSKSGASTYWENLDPHVDALNIFATVEPVTVARNLIDMRADKDASVSINNAIRSVPNTGTDALHGSVLITENVVHYDPDRASAPIESATKGNDNVFPDRIVSNWLSPNLSGNFLKGSAPAGTIWQDNVDMTTGLVIPPPGDTAGTTDAVSRFSRAMVPLSGTASAGAVIEARALSTDDGGATSTSWATVATAEQDGTWSGDLAAPRNTSWYRPEVRLKAAPATVVTGTRRFAAGHVWARWAQSDEYHIYRFEGSVTPEPVLDDDALQIVFMVRGFLQDAPQPPGTAFLERVTDAGVKIPGFATMSNAFAREFPGEKFMIALHAQSGNGLDERVNEADGRRFKADEEQIHGILTADGTKVGFVHEFFSSGTPSNLLWEGAVGPIQFGINPDGTPFTGTSVPTYSGGTQRVDWTLDEFYDWSYSRFGFMVGYDDVGRTRLVEMATHPVYHDFFALHPRGAESSGWLKGELNQAGTKYNDTAHPGIADSRGAAQMAWILTYAAMLQNGLLPGGMPAINTVELHPNGNQKAVALGWTGGPLTTTRRRKGAPRLTGQAKFTDIMNMGWNGQNTRAEIRDDNGNLADVGRIWVYKPDGSDWTGNDVAAIDINDWNSIVIPDDKINGFQFDDFAAGAVGVNGAVPTVREGVIPDLFTNYTAYPPGWGGTTVTPPPAPPPPPPSDVPADPNTNPNVAAPEVSAFDPAVWTSAAGFSPNGDGTLTVDMDSSAAIYNRLAGAGEPRINLISGELYEIRMVVTAASAGELRLTEIEAYDDAGGNAEVLKWSTKLPFPGGNEPTALVWQAANPVSTGRTQLRIGIQVESGIGAITISHLTVKRQ